MRFPVTSLVWAILMTPPEVLADEAGLPQPPHSVQGRAIANMLASRLPRLPTDFASATDLRRRLLPLLLEETRASVASSLRDALAAQPQGGGRKRGGGRGAAAAVGMPVRLPVASLTTLSTGVLRRGGGDSGLHAVELDVEACHGNAARDLMPNDAVLLVVTQASRGRPAARHCGTSYHACLGVVEAVGKPSQAASGQSRRSGAAPGPALGSASDASVPLAAKMARLLVRRPAGGVVGPDGNALYPRLLDAAVAAAVSQRGFRPTHLGVSGPQPVEGGGTPSSSTSSSSAAAAAAAAPGAASAAQRSASAPLVSPVEPSALLSALSVSVINLGSLSVPSLRWDAVVIDEACQATEPSVMVAIAAATTTREDGRAAGAPPTVVLVGDPCQLPATLLSKRSSSSGLGRSTFERVLAASADGGRTVADVISPHAPHLAPAAASWRPGGAGGYFLLSTQYRMHPDIRAFPGREFYGDKLRDGIRPEDPLAAAASLGPEQALQRVVPWQAFYACDVFAPLRFFDLRPMHPAPSRFENPSEARFVARLVAELLRVAMVAPSRPGSDTPARQDLRRRIGVISPYRKQVSLVQGALRAELDAGGNTSRAQDWVTVSTVDGFQGQEQDVIVISAGGR
ncbi:hypothetical protein FNF28_04120 [Cafeteria roenbergensis]|uniref:DNA2/NAM7 helicase-like C-terminal domain-containing protein n=1 Tax=Cafeteria roenbergensis TaxID=33653 RepID=A0A5A8DHQ0_CAFRO|nr:hypothetical protein FNF28_04120 [Cafeteria roenbergensis]